MINAVKKIGIIVLMKGLQESPCEEGNFKLRTFVRKVRIKLIYFSSRTFLKMPSVNTFQTESLQSQLYCHVHSVFYQRSAC